MSATNRGAKRHKNDFYETPQYCIDNFLSHYKIEEGLILDPCCGTGAFPKVIRRHGYNNGIDAVDIESPLLPVEEVDSYQIHDFLTFRAQKQYTTIISNPPFSIAQEFIEKSKQLNAQNIIFLLRLSFLESAKRHDFWQKHPVNDLYVLSDRPSFTGTGTDACAYAFFVWNNSSKQHVYVI